MSSLHRVLLILSVTVLLREASSNSPFDFFRDLKNRIFSSGNSTESNEEPVQCSGSSQDGVCTSKTLYNSSLDETDNVRSTEMFDNSDLNGTLNMDSEISEFNQKFGNETYNVETNNTVYYDEQDWNSIATNNTENQGDFEYQEIDQNTTTSNTENLLTNEENQSDDVRSKRQTKNVEINIMLKTGNKPSASRATVFTAKSENSSDLKMNVTVMPDEIKEVLSNDTGSNHTGFSDSKNDLNITGFVDNRNKTVKVEESTSDEGNENTTIYKQEISEQTNAKLDLEDLVSKLNSSALSAIQNKTEETFVEQSTTTNCSVCMAIEQKYFPNATNELGLNETEQTNSTENSTAINNEYINDQTNVTNLANILVNSTRLIENMAETLIPASMLSKLDNYTEDLLHLLSNQTDKLENITINTTELENNFKNLYNITMNMTNIIGEDPNILASILNQNVNSSNIFKSQGQILNVSQTNVADNLQIKREKRSINFTILSDDDNDSSFSTFPEVTELSVIETVNSTNSILLDNDQTIEVVGPVCLSRYEQCLHSSDCCEPYDCISREGPNSTFHCDQPAR